ncbi:hypothetical protein [Nocardioides sp. SR21]|uniref:hypothetical protein n=1 Tax=Nocardioides sp. SR21 TaxID=2919501 RepID=UPI001FAADA7A|nr:hypothetical protein [Nocardioides sp. SR21]
MSAHRAVRDLSDRHFGRTLTVPGKPPITGTLVGLIGGPGTNVTLALIVGGARAWVPVERGRCIDLQTTKESA